MHHREEATIRLPISKQEVVIKEGDGYTERALLKKNRKVYETIPYYLAAMTVSIGDKSPITREDILKLLTPDQEYLMIECYRLNFGDTFEFGFRCPHCEKDQEVAFNLDDLEFRSLPDDLDADDPTITVNLPRSGRRTEIGMLNGEQELILLDLAASGTLDLNQADYQCLRSLDGSRDFTYEEVVNLPLADHKAIRKGRKKLLCGYDTNIAVTCESCEKKDAVNILMHQDFLLCG